MLNGFHTEAQRPAVRGGPYLTEAEQSELESIPGDREAAGNIEIKRTRAVSWLLVTREEGMLVAAHRALDLYLEEGGKLHMKVLRKARPELYLQGIEWEVVIEFFPVKEEGIRSGEPDASG